MNVKINFVGAQGTGKTTLLEAARKDEAFKDFQFCTEIVRELVKKKNLSINESGNAKSQKAFFDAYNRILNKDGYISDRCIIDVHAYTNYLYDYKSSNSEKEFQSLYKEILRENSILKSLNKDSFGIIIYFPIEFELVDDGIRSLNSYFQEYIDQFIVDTLNKYQLPFYTIRGSVEQRLKQLKEIIFSHVQMLQHNEKM
uniref:AAA domain protein n=1 Tax=Siphoviridae sp. ct3r22 TaxID=2825325 RepID=A0A8S5V0S2_9CAUD|nr:MAG TPA: AAA domain protein [Siphoviridae sp. ct3r22]